MKKIILATAALALVFVSCNHEPEFDGMKEYSPGNVLKLELTYAGDYTSTGGFLDGEDNSDDPTAPAKINLEKWMNSTYYTAEKGSEATIKYNLLKTSYSDEVGFNEDFQRNFVNGANTEIDGWMNYFTGEKTWINKIYSGNAYTQMANGDAETTEAWLITPKYTVIKGDKLSFDVCVGYYKGDCLQVFISEDFSGSSSDVTSKYTTWEDVTENFDIPKEPDNAYGKLGPAGEMDLSSYEGKAINIAFKYSGAADTKTTTIQLDNIHIAREVSETSTVVKEARAVVDNDKSAWTVTLPSDIPDILVNEDFEKGKDYDNVVLEGWCNSKVKGEKSWEYRSYQNNRYANITAYNNGELETWLITPALVMQKEMVLNFDFEYRYLAGDVFTLMISTDFNGDPSSISSATWVDVTPDNLDKTNDKSFTSYSVDLASYIGQTIYVGFRYIGDNATGLTTTCQIDNVYVGIPK